MNNINIIKGQLNEIINMIEADVKNCPDNVWTMKLGGDYFWQQAVHALASVQLFLIIPESEKQTPPIKTKIDPAAMSLREGEPKSTVSKEEVLDLAREAKKFTDAYFNAIDESMLAKNVSFFGQQRPLLAMLILTCSHIMYHQGVCDAMLRDNGAESAL